MSQKQLVLAYYSPRISVFTLGFRAGFKNYKPTQMHNPEYMRGYKEGQRRRDIVVKD